MQEAKCYVNQFSSRVCECGTRGCQIRHDTNFPFQSRVLPWFVECLGPDELSNKEERTHRFLEEALELAQSCGCTQDEAHQLVDYVYGRPVGEKHQEVGGVMTTLAMLCNVQSMDMNKCGEIELARVWTKVEQIREKQMAKPRHSPLPGPSAEEHGALAEEHY